ncbi:MAG: O-antigen ligase family protein [Planctomycetes bacterium]|nr:O-antigen ligase family protein [Planctomycetota bacterium]
MRVYALLAITGFLSLYAFRNWFASLCGLIVLMAVVQHPDFPTSIGDIQGLNPWNGLLLCIVIAWWVQRRREGLAWDLPRSVALLLTTYAIAVFVSFARLAMDRENVVGVTTGYLVSEYFINCYKWVIPGLLLFDGCRTRGRFHAALASMLAVYFLLALQVIRWMPTSSALTGGTLNHRALKIILNEVGYHPVNMSMMLAGASWATLAVVPLLRRRWQQAAAVIAGLTIAYGQALTGGRMGYVTWGLVGLALGALRWRKLLLLLPVVAIGVVTFLPGVSERMLRGFGATDATGKSYTDDYEVTSGRTLAWPYVIDKIYESPAVGYGRLAMERTGISGRLMQELQEEFPHPHNAYLECLLDNGVVGFLMIVPFYLVVMKRTVSLLLDRESRYYAAIGGVGFALVSALLIAAMGSQTFYPREGAVGMWCAIGLMLRMSLMREAAHARAAAPALSCPTLRSIPSLATS